MTRAIRIFWRILLIGIGSFALLLLLTYWGVFGKLPSTGELENPSLVLESQVFGDDGTILGKYYKEGGHRSYIKYQEISPHVIDALISTEDKRFYKHSGIDAKRIASAFIFLGTHGGGSTITQQLAKNMLGQGSDNPVKRVFEKLKEWIIAVQLERRFTKQEILALYLNTVAFSDDVYGIRNAARTFYSKPASELTIDEAAVLVAMLKGPGIYNPRTRAAKSIGRRNIVIRLMEENGCISTVQANEAVKTDLHLHYKKLNQNNGTAPYLLDRLRREMIAWCATHTREDGKPYNLYEDGLRIYTTINPHMQQYAEEAVASQLPGLQQVLDRQAGIRNGTVWNRHENILEAQMKQTDRWKIMKEDGLSEAAIKNAFHRKVKMTVFDWNEQRQKDTLLSPYDSIKYHHQMLQTGFMAMDPLTGQVKAWVGGIDFRTYKFDHVNINTKRQVGSSIKPFLYALAIEDYGFTPQTECEATQQYFPDYDGYVPARENPRHTGTRTMATGLAYSINEVAAYLIKQTTPQRFVDFLQQIRIPTKVTPYPSLALGTCDLSLYEMMWGYTMFPNIGINTRPIYLTRIEDKDGNVLATFDTDRKEVISQSTAYTMARMMQGPVDIGTAAGLRNRLGVAEMGGKTGTTNDYSDAWFMGFTPQLEAGVWVGCDDRFIRLETSLGEGGRAARPIWEAFFKKALADSTLGLDRNAVFTRPDSLPQKLTNWQPAPPGAQGEDVGNGTANDYY